MVTDRYNLLVFKIGCDTVSIDGLQIPEALRLFGPLPVAATSVARRYGEAA